MRLEKRHRAGLKFLVLVVGAYLLAAVAVRTYQFMVVEAAVREVAVLAPVVIDRLVVVDPGHGGPDPGVVREGIKEKDLYFCKHSRQQF
ncbi:hypothetical protein [Thermodesulfitimonas sp.]